VFDTAALVVAAVFTELPRLAVFDAAALVVAAVLAEPARLAVFDAAALVVAVVVTLLPTTSPRITCAEVVTEDAPATLRFLVSAALAVGLAAPVIAPARDADFERGAAVVAAQFIDAANDCNTPPVPPFKAAALRAEPFSSIHYLVN
jgi:hypothetical protein